jgi:hypothetical protein
MVEPRSAVLRRAALAAVLLAVAALLLPAGLRLATDGSRLSAPGNGQERPIAAAVLSVPTTAAHRTPVHDLGGPGAMAVGAVGLGVLLLLVGVRRRAAAPAVTRFSTPTRGRGPPQTTHLQ